MSLMDIRVNVLDGNSLHLSLPDNTSVKQLMELLREKTGIEEDCQVILYMGRVLEQDKLLSEYNVHSGVCIQLVRHQRRMSNGN